MKTILATDVSKKTKHWNHRFQFSNERHYKNMMYYFKISYLKLPYILANKPIPTFSFWIKFLLANGKLEVKTNVNEFVYYLAWLWWFYSQIIYIQNSVQYYIICRRICFALKGKAIKDGLKRNLKIFIAFTFPLKCSKLIEK